jgi:hypothetical protein
VSRRRVAPHREPQPTRAKLRNVTRSRGSEHTYLPGIGGGRQEIAFIVVASAIGKDEVFDSINAAANTRYEVVGVRRPAERLATVKTAPGLQVGQALAQRLGRGQPVSPEKVAVKVLLFGGDFVDRPDQCDFATVRRRRRCAADCAG